MRYAGSDKSRDVSAFSRYQSTVELVSGSRLIRGVLKVNHWFFTDRERVFPMGIGLQACGVQVF